MSCPPLTLFNHRNVLAGGQVTQNLILDKGGITSHSISLLIGTLWHMDILSNRFEFGMMYNVE